MKISDAKSLGAAIRERRKELKYTQAFLSEFTGLSASFISDLERGKPTSEIEKTLLVINMLGMDLCLEKRGWWLMKKFIIRYYPMVESKLVYKA